MCGIAGLVRFDGHPVDVVDVERMCDALRHRGPDDAGVVGWPAPGARAASAAAIGNRRLSIVDVAGGHQPISNETSDVWTVLNGEIYNHTEVRARLEALGHRFATRSDTEVIVHAYEQYGEACVDVLDGMFAFAVWDARAERLLLARDRFGKKPLCYWATGTRLAFASELQSLMRVADIPRVIDAEALGDYLAYMAIPAPRTIYRDVRKLPPAHVLIADRTGVTVRRYWGLRCTPKSAVAEPDAIAEIRRLLAAAVDRRLMSEVPLGAFLSGGVDSSAVVAMMARAGRRVRTFSIGFEDAAYDELPYARRVAAHFGCQHEEFVVRPDAVEILPRLIRHFGEPFADSSAIPTAYLAERTRAHVTVALSGDGGDEVFAGYGRHRANAVAEQVVVRAVAKGLHRWTGAAASRVGRFLAAAAADRAGRYRRWAGVCAPELIRALAPRASDGQAAVTAAYADAAALDAVDAMLSVDTNVYLPTDLLVKMDITTMASSLEARSPLLDTALAEFVAPLPTSLKIRRGTTKYLLKRAMAGIVPDDILQREKRGFAVPIGAWLRGPLYAFAADHLSHSTAAAGGWLVQPAVSALLAEHREGRRDHAHQLWTLLALELWYRTAVAE